MSNMYESLREHIVNEFPTARLSPTPVSDEKTSKEERTEAWKRGFRASENGLSEVDNPFIRGEGDLDEPSADDWDEGYSYAMALRREEETPGKEPALASVSGVGKRKEAGEESEIEERGVEERKYETPPKDYLETEIEKLEKRPESRTELGRQADKVRLARLKRQLEYIKLHEKPGQYVKAEESREDDTAEEKKWKSVSNYLSKKEEEKMTEKVADKVGNEQR